MKTFDKITIGIVVIALVTFIIEMCLGHTTSPIWLTTMWCFCTLINFGCKSISETNLEKLTSIYNETLNTLFETQWERDELKEKYEPDEPESFDSLEEKCNWYRKTKDYVLPKGEYILVMVDGHTFSKKIRDKFEKPFDDKFINAMNETARYLCENIQGCRFAFVQSDEISLLLDGTGDGQLYFGGRLCKIQSIVAAMATAKFNQVINFGDSSMRDEDLYDFDCKAWNVGSDFNDAYCWFLWRQNDCIKNSKNQTAYAYLSHKSLLGKTADERVQMLIDQKGVDWNQFPDDRKYGRLIYPEKVEVVKEITKKNGEKEVVTFMRNIYSAHPAIQMQGNQDFLLGLTKRDDD